MATAYGKPGKRNREDGGGRTAELTSPRPKGPRAQGPRGPGPRGLGGPRGHGSWAAVAQGPRAGGGRDCGSLGRPRALWAPWGSLGLPGAPGAVWGYLGLPGFPRVPSAEM